MNYALVHPHNHRPPASASASAGAAPQTPARYPLASVQQAIWFDQMLHPDLPCYNIGAIWQLDGALDPALLETCIQEVVHAHDGLRLQLHRTAGSAVQQVMPSVDFALPCHDFAAHADAQARAEHHLKAVFGTPFALHGTRLWASQLARIGPTRHQWLFYGHHVIFDGISCFNAAAWVIAAYRRRARGDVSVVPAGPPYLDFLAEDRAYLGSPRYARDARFWNERFSRMPAPLWTADPARQGAPAVPVPSVPFEIDRRLYARIDAFAAAAGGSVSHCVLALLAVLFSRTHGTDEVVIGVPVHNRRTARDKLTIGMFSSVIPVRIAVDPEQPFAMLMEDVAAELRSCYRHQRFPIADLNRALHLARHGRRQLFDITLAMEAFSGIVEHGMPACTTLHLHSGFEQTPLALRVCDYNADGHVTLEFHHNPAFLRRDAVEMMRRRFERLLHAVLADGGAQPVAALALLDPAEREQVLVRWNDTAQDYPRELCVHQRFEAQVRRTPQATALVHGARTLSYQSLNAWANRLARRLRAQGAGPDRLVALCLERGPALVVAILAVLKAGGAYVPLDPAHASERLGAILDDSRPAVLVLDEAGRAALGAMSGGFVAIDPHGDAPCGSEEDSADLPPDGLTARHLAYVIYTSGSTGLPKGVMVEHRSLHNLVAWHIGTFGLRPGSRSAATAGLGFDASVWEMWPTLCSGGCLALPLVDGARDPQQLLQWWAAQPLDVGFLVTPLAELAYATGHINPAAHTVLIGGERLRRWPDALPAGQALVNNYGPTETTVVASSGRLHAGDTTANIGRPIANTRIYVLDARMQPVPIGVEGELYIGGDGVAR
ncbi:AMP-binding protein, partial [Sphingomonas sp. NCPPB 2930]